VSFAAITLYVASQRVVVVYYDIDTVGNFWLHPRMHVCVCVCVCVSLTDQSIYILQKYSPLSADNIILLLSNVYN
jgi:hypothetical protein